MSVFSLPVQIHALTKFERISIHISLTAEISKIHKLAKTNIPNPKKLRHIHRNSHNCCIFRNSFEIVTKSTAEGVQDHGEQI